jgi:hypothetical protein
MSETHVTNLPVDVRNNQGVFKNVTVTNYVVEDDGPPDFIDLTVHSKASNWISVALTVQNNGTELFNTSHIQPGEDFYEQRPLRRTQQRSLS